MCAAHRRSEDPASVAVAPPTALPRAPGWRDRRRTARARRIAGVEIARDARVVLGRDVVFDLVPGARLVIGAGVALGDGCRFHIGPDATVIVDEATRLGEKCVITAHERVTIGAGCVLADEVVLLDGDPRVDDVERPVREQGLSTSPIAIAAHVRIGPGAAILRGVTIGAGAAIGAHAVVTHDLAPGATVDGVPAGGTPEFSAPPRRRGTTEPR
jgi:carbonic anhydrase/acetyltransferase-like protein (isoleucine patch superfamily)